MLRKIAALPVFLAMMMVLMATFVPHHHLRAICCHDSVSCLAAGACHCHDTDADAEHEEGESHCLWYANYCFQDDIRMTDIPVLPAVSISAPAPVVFEVSRPYQARISRTVFQSPPILSWRINC